MLVHTAAVHAIGEDNEGNVALVARTREALVAKVLAFANEAYGDDPSDPEDARTPFVHENDLYDAYDVSWGTDELED